MLNKGHHMRRLVRPAAPSTGGSTAPNIVLCHLDNNATDERGHTTTANSMTYSNTVMKWGYGGVFDGTNSNVDLTYSTDFDAGSSDFVIEAWVRLNSLATTQRIFQHRDGSGGCWLSFSSSTGFSFGIWNDGWVTVCSLSEGDTTGDAIDTWYHIAGVRSGINFYLFKDGGQVATSTSSATIDAFSGDTKIGSGTTSDLVTLDLQLNGVIDEFGWTIGSDKGWSGGFTPDTSPYI